ncbi:MAG: transglycosylase domain-containing protein, partial [Bacteroidales bacterium]
MKLKKKHYILFLLTSVFLAGYFIIRSFAHNFIEKQIRQMTYKGMALSFKEVAIEGLNGIQFSDLSLITPNKDTLFQTKNINIELSAWKLLRKEIDVRHISISNSSVYLHKDSVSCNYTTLFSDSLSSVSSIEQTDKESGFSEKANNLGSILFNLIPEQLKLDKFDINYSYYNQTMNINIASATIHNGVIHSVISTSNDSAAQHLFITGEMNKKNRFISGMIINKDSTQQVFVPFIRAKYDANIQWSAMNFELNFPELNKDHSVIDLALKLKNLSILQPRLADTTICVPQLKTNMLIDLTSNKIHIDPKSCFQIDQVQFHPEITLEKNETWRVRALLNEKNIAAAAFIRALPEGLFGPIKTVKAEGEVDYHFLFDLDLANPDSLKLESDITKKNFRVLDPGNLSKMNGSFLYTAFENGKPLRSFIVGPENSNFTPASQVSPLLINAILQSEDGQFFYHKGFRIDAIREALIHDVKVRKFARGGSTISMQIVKNVFLDRNKNIARKLEEAMIVWMIESNAITSKQRMFDVYLNIIEWGPGTYGVREAANYYFRKS